MHNQKICQIFFTFSPIAIEQTMRSKTCVDLINNLKQLIKQVPFLTIKSILGSLYVMVENSKKSNYKIKKISRKLDYQSTPAMKKLLWNGAMQYHNLMFFALVRRVSFLISAAFFGNDCSRNLTA